MRLLLRVAQFLVFCSFVAGNARAQDLIAAKDLPAATRILDNASLRNSLPCAIRLPKKAGLDFMFRYTAGFQIECRFGLIQPGTRLLGLVRITPEGSQPVVMIKVFDVPALRAEELTRYSISLHNLTVQMSGVFAMGPGRYLLEVVLTDPYGHACRGQRKVKADGREVATIAPLALGRGTVAPLLKTRWDGALATSGLRLTILLHAYSPGRARISALDRAYLLQSLTVLLGQVHCQSVKLIAFNLDRQEDVFHEDGFDADGFVKLERALEQMELATIPYQALMQGSWAKFLVDMTRKEATLEQPPDAIIFLGAWGSHEWDKLPRDTARLFEGLDTHIFYFEYFEPAQLGHGKDGLARLVKELHGSAFVVWSPETLAQAIGKMLASLRSGGLNHRMNADSPPGR